MDKVQTQQVEILNLKQGKVKLLMSFYKRANLYITGYNYLLMETIKRISRYYKPIALAIVMMFLVVPESVAQNTLEFAKVSGDNNPTGNGPVVSTTINFLQNTTGTTFALYNTTPLSATVAFTNQVYDAAVVSTPAGSVIMGHSGASGSSGPESIYTTDGWYGSPSNSNFTSVNSAAGAGISITNNYAISVRNFNRAIGNTHNVRAKVFVGRMEVTFSRSVTNPIIHLSGF